MTLFIASLVAGFLTILAPCILPVLPVIVGSTSSYNRNNLRAFIVVLSLCISVVVFTLLLKGSSLLLGVPQSLWQFISAAILIGLGIAYIFPKLWEYMSFRTNVSLVSQQSLSEANRREGLAGAILTGAALGPVFTSCSPTYLFIVAAILPADILSGLLYVITYAVGLGLSLGLASYFGIKLTRKLGWGVNPNGIFKKLVGAILILVGLLILTGFDKQFQAFVIDNGWYAPIESIESSLR